MNVFLLKLIALTTMIIDHYGAIFHSDIYLFRMIGRLAFPIYCFLLVEGYFHTKDIKKYATRLFIFALMSEIAFDYAFYGKLELGHQNIFFTLLIGLCAMYFLDNKEGKYSFSNKTVLIIAGILALFISVDYSFIGIIYILAFYFTKDYPNPKRLYRVGLTLILTNLLFASMLQQFSLLALPIIYFYNGNLGPKNKILQWSFYIAYPLHLFVFYMIKTSI